MAHCSPDQSAGDSAEDRAGRSISLMTRALIIALAIVVAGAFDAYGNSLNGEIGREYDWEHGTSHGTFMSTREYRDGDQLCRDFRTTTYRNGQRYDREGTACRTNDGNWQTR
jgi:hypothetical protein